MSISISVLHSLSDINPAEYRAFFLRSKAPLYYDWRFLKASEESPLLPMHKIFYIQAREEGKLVSQIPVYLQDISIVDPLGVLARSVNLAIEPGDKGLFSHIMQCCNTTIPALTDDPRLYTALFETLSEIAQGEGARYFGFLNVNDGSALDAAQDNGLNIHYMVDKYSVDLNRFDNFDHLHQKLNQRGRTEMNRQLRKFDASKATVSIKHPPFGGELEQLAHMCQQTTTRLGTPQYWPAEPLARFCRLCEDIIRLAIIEVDGQLISGFICFEEEGTLHAWTAGMDYETTDFSPYTIGTVGMYQYAFEKNLKSLEAGRLNERIKTRLGLNPSRLYAIVSHDLHALSTKQTSRTNNTHTQLRTASHPAFEEWYQNIAWNKRDFSRKPAGVLQVKKEADITAAIAFAKNQQLTVSVRGGGHSYAGSFLRTNALLLDLSAMNRIEIDPRRARAIVEPGVTSEQLCAALAQHNLAFPTGHGRGVAVSGFLLGGGLGINCSAWGGMSIFNVEAMDIITADGHHQHVDKNHNPDLFWAARGSGPTAFFIVTRFYLRCYPQPKVISNSVYAAPFSALSELLTEIEKNAPPKNLQVMLAIAPSPAGETPSLILNTIAYEQSPEQAHQLRENLLTNLSAPLTLLDEDQRSGFEGIYRQTDAMVISSRYRSDNILTNRTQDIQPILERHITQSPSLATTMLIAWRGKQSYPDAAFSAQGTFFVSTYAQWNSANDDARNHHWLKGLYDELKDISSNAYINEFDLEERATEVSRCFSTDHWQRLEALRRQYDPEALFVRIETLGTEGQEPH